MTTENALCNGSYLLQKFPGKGGWTYAEIPEVLQDKSNPFGWVKVKGSIDGHTFKNYKLMPMGNGRLFLPVKAEIRKKIGKQEGDSIRVILFADNAPTEIPEELLACLKDEPPALENFKSLTDGQKKEFIDWIASAKTIRTRTARIVETIDMALRKETFRRK